jgi:hypothetical protein
LAGAVERRRGSLLRRRRDSRLEPHLVDAVSASSNPEELRAVPEARTEATREPDEKAARLAELAQEAQALDDVHVDEYLGTLEPGEFDRRFASVATERITLGAGK